MMIARYCGYRGQTIIKPGWKEISLHHRFRKVTKKDHENVVIPVSGLQDHLDRLDRTALMISAQSTMARVRGRKADANVDTLISAGPGSLWGYRWGTTPRA
jgi:hypothetical protein